MNRPLSLVQLTALVAGNMIGAGIFLLPSNLAMVGTISLLAWLLSAMGAILLALMFAKLSVEIPGSGGPYRYTRKSLGYFLSFQTAYHQWIAIWVGNAAIALAFVGYASIFWPSLNKPTLACIAAIGLIWLLTFINCLGVRVASQLQSITFILKLLPIVLISILGWRLVHFHFYQTYFNIAVPAQTFFQALSKSAALTFWAFIGLESATVPNALIKQPKRNIPLATILGTSIAALSYILTSAVIMGIIPAFELQHDAAPFATVTQLLIGPWAQYFVAAGAMIACLGSLNGWIMLQGQVPIYAAKEGFAPKIFAQLNRYQAPAQGLIITSLFISSLLLLTLSSQLIKQFEKIILLAVLAALIPYLYTAIAELTLLKQSAIPYRKKIIPLIRTTLAATFTVWIILSSGERTLYYGCLLLLSSVPIYALLKEPKNYVS